MCHRNGYNIYSKGIFPAQAIVVAFVSSDHPNTLAVCSCVFEFCNVADRVGFCSRITLVIVKGDCRDFVSIEWKELVFYGCFDIR